MQKVTIFFHGYCFDGAVSCALFKHFYLKTLRKEAQFTYVPLEHEVGFSYDDRMFTADVNVVLDFRYPPSNRVAWWFDHHQTTFIANGDRAHLEGRPEGAHFHFDPNAPSNSGLMVRVLSEQYGLQPSRWHETLVQWADAIDAANFASPDIPVELLEPAVAFAFLLEEERDEKLLVSFIDQLAREHHIEDMATIPYWSTRLNQLRQKSWSSIEDMKGRLLVESQVSFIDLTDRVSSGYNKFIPYYLAPLVDYSVALLRLEHRLKISVGANPFSTTVLHNGGVDIGSLCKSYGGGGHYSVGAIPFSLTEEARAQETVKEILTLLREHTARRAQKRKESLIEATPDFALLKQR